MRIPRFSGEKRIFLAWFTGALCFFILLFGFGTVDSTGKRMSFNDRDGVVSVEDKENGETMLKIDFMDIGGEVDITPVKKFFDFFCEFTCISNK